MCEFGRVLRVTSRKLLTRGFDITRQTEKAPLANHNYDSKVSDSGSICSACTHSWVPRWPITASQFTFFVEPIHFVRLVDDVLAKQCTVHFSHIYIARTYKIVMGGHLVYFIDEITHANTTTSAGNSDPSLSTRLLSVNFLRVTPLLTLIFPSAMRSAPPLSSPVKRYFCKLNAR